MASITPINGRAAFITAQDPHTYWELNTTNLGTGFGRDTSGNDNNTNVASGDISTADSYEGMNNQNDPPQNGWMDTAIVTDAAALIYVPADLAHGTNYGLWSNGGGTNGEGAFMRATPTGVEMCAAHNDGSASLIDAVVYEIPDADLPGWFTVSWQFLNTGGVNGDMGLWVNGTLVASGTRVYAMDWGSGNPDFGNNGVREPSTSHIIDGPTANGNWANNTSINGSGILIANFAADNPAMTGSAPDDASPGAGDTWHTDYFDAHADSATTVSGTATSNASGSTGTAVGVATAATTVSGTATSNASGSTGTAVGVATVVTISGTATSNASGSTGTAIGSAEIPAAGAVHLGDNAVIALYLGDTAISKAYLGDTLVFGTETVSDTFTSTFQENF